MKSKWLIVFALILIVAVILLSVSFGISMKRSNETIDRVDRHIEEVLNGR